MSEFNSSAAYEIGAIVTSSNEAFVKANPATKRSSATPTPGDKSGVWAQVKSNAHEFCPIEAQLSTYETRRDAAVAQRAVERKAAEDKLTGLGLSAAELAAFREVLA